MRDLSTQLFYRVVKQYDNRAVLFREPQVIDNQVKQSIYQKLIEVSQ